MPPDPKVFVVVLNWNRPADTAECLRSLQAVDYANLKIRVVDNGSKDGSLRALREQFPDVPVLANVENLGYSGGNNVGIRHCLESGADYVLLLNNDTVVDKALVKELVKTAGADAQIGIMGPKIYDYGEPNKIWFAGATIDWSSGDSPHIGLGQDDRGQFDGVVEVDRLTGCAMMVRREVFQKVGLLDPAYFLYYEDVDLCVRASRAGYKNVCVQTARMWHKESSSTKANERSDLHTYYQTRNRLLLLKKHSSRSDSAQRDSREFRNAYIRHFVRHPFDQAYRAAHSARFWGIQDFYWGRFGIKPRYTEV